MWKQIKLLGRDNILSRQIRPRLKEGKGFVLTGTHGVGKTAVLEWIAVNAGDKVSMISATSTVKEIMLQICMDWKLEVKNDEGKIVGKTRWQVIWMERAILQVKDGWLLVDDIHRVTPALLRRLKLLRDRVKIIAAGVPPFQREELRRLLS
jgi:type II secretory pathway predicted ATPase ExeA